MRWKSRLCMPIFETSYALRFFLGYRKGLQAYTSIIGARACFAHTFGVVVEGAQELIFPVPSSCDSTLKRNIQEAPLRFMEENVRTHSAKRKSPGRKLLAKLKTSTAPLKAPFVARSVIMRLLTALSCFSRASPASFDRSVQSLSMHFLVSN